MKSYIKTKSYKMSYFSSFLEKLGFDGYQQVFLNGDPNAIAPIDLNRPYHSKVKQNDSHLTCFEHWKNIQKVEFL